jgi:hypothetical protein
VSWGAPHELSDSRLRVAHAAARERLDAYERACTREGGFDANDPRGPAMIAAGFRLDDLEWELARRQEWPVRPACRDGRTVWAQHMNDPY